MRLAFSISIGNIKFIHNYRLNSINSIKEISKHFPSHQYFVPVLLMTIFTRLLFLFPFFSLLFYGICVSTKHLAAPEIFSQKLKH